MESTETNHNEDKSSKFPLIIIILLIAIWIFSSLNINMQQFLIWEVFVSLFPFSLIFFVFVWMKWGNWHDFLGGGGLCPWAFTVSATAMRRVWNNKLDQWYLILGIIIILAAGIFLGIATYLIKHKSSNEIEDKKNLKNMSIASIVIACSVIVLGILIAGKSVVM